MVQYQAAGRNTIPMNCSTRRMLECKDLRSNGEVKPELDTYLVEFSK